MTPQDRISLGARADALLNDIAFQAACDEHERELFQRWKTAKVLADREMLWAECQALTAVKGRLSALRLDGALVKSKQS